MPGRQDQIAEASARLAAPSGALARLPPVTLMRDVGGLVLYRAVVIASVMGSDEQVLRGGSRLRRPRAGLVSLSSNFKPRFGVRSIS